MALGALRESIGTGTLLNRAELMFGERASGWTIHLFGNYEGFLLAILPPGAFIGLGLIIAMKNVVDARAKTASEKRVIDSADQALVDLRTIGDRS